MPWSMTEAKYNSVVNRLTSLEEYMNDVLVAIGNYVTDTQVQEVLVVLTQQINALSQGVEELEQRVTNIEETPA